MSSAPSSQGPPSPARKALRPLLLLARLAKRPLERFLRIEAASGILLLVAAALALAAASSPWAASYRDFWQTPIAIRLGIVAFGASPEWVVNDGLMVIFFFVVGMEIRREIHHGELSEWRRAALPAGAALGGMLAPAGLYLALAGAPPTRSGWGVPMATDIAFAVGILTLLGKRVPAALRVLLLALAVIDDLGAIIVIALFYSSGIAPSGLVVAALGLVCLLVMQRLGVRAKLAYVAPAVVIWAGVYTSGIHPTIAGVVIGLLTPVTDDAESAPGHDYSPSGSLIETLHPWVAFGIMPIFALANAGVSLSTSALDAGSWTVVTAVTVALVAGKPLGVLLVSGLLIRTKLAILPLGLGARHLLVLGVVAGVGFTMALFIAQLAFRDPGLLGAAKLGVLTASAVAACLTLVLGRLLLAPTQVAGAAESADEAEASTEA
jgi:Na+:H+ antiporter, NhaA family